ncbi:MAG: hypothetical protein IJC79_05495 [Clostridia bacterium]|nr:hypothetical protein [Clostridia bacterium]
MFASFEKDYIMRIVKEMVRMLLKLLFDIDTTRSMEDVIKEAEEKQTLDRLIKMTDEGFVNEAENELYEITLDGDRTHLKTALIFYYHLAEKDEDFLFRHGYTQEEVKEGVEDLIERYGVKDIADLFMET